MGDGGDHNSPSSGRIYIGGEMYAKLSASTPQNNDNFGGAVDMDGNYAAVGAEGEDGGEGDPVADAGAVYIYKKEGNKWSESAILRASDAQTSDAFGMELVMKGDTLFVGAFMEDGGAGDPLNSAGAVYVFERSGESWNETQILRASDVQANDSFGRALSFDGTTLVVGASGEDGGAGDPVAQSGAAYVFRKSGGRWTEQCILRASDPQTSDIFGCAVAVYGNTIAVGAFNEDGGAGDPMANAGAVYLFAPSGGGWNQYEILRSGDIQAGDYFGGALGLWDNALIVGAINEDGGAGDPVASAGAAYIFRRSTVDGWKEEAVLRLDEMGSSDEFGTSVDIRGHHALVGAFEEDGGAGDPVSECGGAFLYRWSSGGWTLVESLHPREIQVDDYFGEDLSLCENGIIVGASGEDGGSGDPTSSCGAAYIYR